jgi:hypothetical protein
MNTTSLFVNRQQGVSFLVWLMVLVWSMFLSPNSARGQGDVTASVAGTVRDSSGAVVPGAQIVITQTDTGFSKTAVTAGDGSFAFPVLPVGPYRLEVKMEGFAGYKQTGIVLTVNQAAQFSVTLQPGGLKQAIEVKASVSPVDTTTGTLSQLVDQRQIVELPLNGRNPAGLVLLALGVSNPALGTGGNSGPNGPGVALQFTYPAGVGGSIEQQGALIPAVNGIRSGGVYFSLDGANNEDAYAVTGGPFPNPDAVQEFRVLTNGYGAEYVSAPGGAVNIVTKSGTNEFHGDIFEFLRNGALNAHNFFAAKQDNIHRHQFGGTAGGPIRKDKLFIFGSYQRTTLRSSTGGDIQFVPTEAQRAGNFSATPNQLHNPFTGAPYPGNQIPLTDFSPVTSKLLAMLPHSSAPDGRVEVVHPTSIDEDQGAAKVDYLLGKHSFVARYFVTDSRTAMAPLSNNLLQVSGPTNVRWQDAMLGYNYVGGNVVNEARFTFQRNSYNTFTGLPESFKSLGANVTQSQNPFIEFMQVAGFFTIPGGSFNGFPRQAFTASDRLSIIRGRHLVSLGGEVTRLEANEHTDHLQSGIAVWAPLPPFPPVPPFLFFTSGNPVSDFLLGKPVAFAQGDGLLARARGTLWGFYGSDQIRVFPRFTLTLGLRWDPYWPFHTLHGRATCFRPGQKSTVFTNAPTGLLFPGDPTCDNSGGIQPDLHTFQPRISFAYSADQKGRTSIRGGYGIYAMQFPMQSFLPFAAQPPYIRTIFRMFPPSLSNPWAGFPGGDPFAAGFLADDQPRPSNVAFPLSQASVFNPNFKLASIQQWNLTLEHLFPGSTIARASYVGTKGTHLSVDREANAAVYIPGLCGSPPSPCSTSQNTDSRRPFQGLQSVLDGESVGNSSYNALQLSVERRMSASLTISSNYTWGKSIDTVSSNANGTLHAGFNTVADPFNLGAYRGLSDFDLRNSFSTSFVWQLPSSKSDSFIPKHVLSHWQATGIWIWQSGEPFSVYSGVDNSLSGVGLDFADLVPGVSPFLNPDRPRSQVVSQSFNIAAFKQNALGTFGNSGRNILSGPGYNNLDFAVMKMIPLNHERYRLTLRGEFFNITNTPHFTAPNGAGGGISTPQAAVITHARDPRIVQLALKFNW